MIYYLVSFNTLVWFNEFLKLVIKFMSNNSKYFAANELFKNKYGIAELGE